MSMIEMKGLSRGSNHEDSGMSYQREERKELLERRHILSRERQGRERQESNYRLVAEVSYL